MRYLVILTMFMFGCVGTFSPPKRVGHLFHIAKDPLSCGDNPPISPLDGAYKKTSHTHDGMTCWIVLCAVPSTKSPNSLEDVYLTSKELGLVVCRYQ